MDVISKQWWSTHSIMTVASILSTIVSQRMPKSDPINFVSRVDVYHGCTYMTADTSLKGAQTLSLYLI